MSCKKPTGDDVRAWVTDYYGQVLKRSADLKTNACCASGRPARWLQQPLANVHADVHAKFYGCGYPFPDGLDGCVVVDLGCGAGRDVYVLSQLVGPKGFVHGIDMTPKQLETANQTLEWHMEKFFGNKSTVNVAFHQGYIEDLSMLPDASVDAVVSNCVVNLSPRKDIVLSEVARVLKTGGEFYFSDVFVDRRLNDTISFDPILHSECLGGALYLRDFMDMSKKAGFLDPRVLTTAPITIKNAEIEEKVGAAKFVSVTLRLFKLPDLDPQCEDYGQTATYKGSISSCPTIYTLDGKHLFEAGRPERVCANTASMITDTRLSKHFQVQGQKTTHYGPFECALTLAAQQYKGNNNAKGGCC